MQHNNPRTQLKVQLAQLKHEAIMVSVNQLLASKGYEQMTVDEVAQGAGMSKASLYKFFDSKEALAGQAMVLVLDQAIALVNTLCENDSQPSIDKLKMLTRWAMSTQMSGKMPSLPAQNSALSLALQNNPHYAQRLFTLSMQLGSWIREAKGLGHLKSTFPDEFILYTLYARACDPVLGLMKEQGLLSHEAIAELMLSTIFDGLAQ